MRALRLVALCATASILAVFSFACAEPVEQASLPENLPPPPPQLVFDLNKVTLEELLSAAGGIDGLNKSVALQIIEFRRKFRYDNVEDLLAVPGIGEKTFLQIRRFFKVSRAD